MGKCIIPRKTRQQPSSSCIIRIDSEMYQAIVDIANTTGRSISDVASRMLTYALENVEIVNEGGAHA